jgi:hypothetical protein
MNVLKKSLLAVVAVFVLAPTAAFALPSPQCNQLCPYVYRPAACVEECWEHLVPTTCGDAGYWCIESDASTDSEAQQADEAPVCNEEHPAEVQPAPGEN